MYDIIIIGAGPAGLSAAIYGVRAGKRVLVCEKKNYGGQIVNTPEVENYPGIPKISGYEFASNLYHQAVELGAEIAYEKVIRIEDEGIGKKVVTEEHVYDCKTVVIATGARNRELGVERENELLGSGVSYCATCDGMFFRGKDVAVVGGGNTALEDALFLSNYCRKVYLIHRRDEFRGESKLLNALQERDNVEFILKHIVTTLKGEKLLSAITIQETDTKEEKDIPVSGLFIAVGQEPENEAFENLVETDSKGYIVAGETCETKCQGIYTAGDCRTKEVRQLTTATSDGAVAALKACEYCNQ